MSAGLHLRVAEGIRTGGLWAAGDRVAVAVSGGRDSVVLLDLLARTQGLHGGVLSVATFDHGTRPDSADDAAFVAERAASLGLPCEVGRATLGPDASEAACRTARRAFLEGLDADALALAHHLDDQAETVLLQWIRGGGTRGMGGMAPRRGRWVRPLLDVRRAELASWAAHQGLTWREDPTNAATDRTRNAVRHEVLPALEALRPGATVAIARGARHAREDDAFLAALAAEQSPAGTRSWARTWVAEGPAPLVRRALQVAWPAATTAHLDAIVDAARRGGGPVQLSEGVAVVVDRDRVSIQGDCG